MTELMQFIGVGVLGILIVSISRSLGRDVYSHLITLTCHTTLLTILIVSLRIIFISLTYVHSKFAIQVFQCDSRYPL
jgi:hypothetical protein